MAAYTEKYTESESDIQNNDLLYNIYQQFKNTFEILETDWKFFKRKTKKQISVS